MEWMNSLPAWALALLHTAGGWWGAAQGAPVVQGMAERASALDTTHLMAVAAALGWASGLRLYAVVFLTGLAGAMGWVPLPSGLQMLQSPVVLGASGFMLAVEFFADKIPGLDSLWDVLHTVVRIPAGAALAAAVFGGDSASWGMAAALMGGTLAATAQAAKMTTRAAINTSPEPFSNIAMSLAGDAAVPVLLWLSWAHPTAFYVALAVSVVLAVVLIVVLLRFLRALVARVRGGWGSSSGAVVG
jgi:hypothetical protein